MAIRPLSAIIADAVDRIVARVERSGELLQRIFLAATFRTLEQDDGTSPVKQLRKLKLAQMLTQGGERKLLIAGRERVALSI